VVQPSVTVNTSASSTAICGSNSATLTASGASSYTWQPGNLSGSSVIVSPSSNTNYTVTGSSGMCSGSKVIAISVGANPAVTAATSESLICAGTAATITAIGASTYSWSTGPTSSSIVVFPVLTTTYAVTGYSNGCSTTYTLVQNVAWCTGVSEYQSGADSYKAFPNPFSEEIKFVANETVEVNMYNSLGQIIKKSTFDTKGSLQTNDLPKGVYIVFMKGNSGMKTFRVIKE
jgi:hypothetical protein